MERLIDLSSDTVSEPTEAMKKAMYDAIVGDDVLSRDPTVERLERISSEILGKESSLLVTSGTMANQLAVMSLTNRGQEVLVGETSHIYNLEVAALATLSQVQARPIEVKNGYYNVKDMESTIKDTGIQRAKVSLICIENTNNLNEGLVVPQENIEEVCKLGRRFKIPVYMDGARVFNAEAATGIDVKDIVKDVDAVMFSLTKGFSAPYGSILAGDKKFIEKARWYRQRIGGGWRQAGVMAAPAIVALKSLRSQFKIDNQKANYLGNELLKILPSSIDLDKIQTNIIMASINNLPISIDKFISELRKKYVVVKKTSDSSFRMVTHLDITDSDINYIIKTFKDLVSKII